MKRFFVGVSAAFSLSLSAAFAESIEYSCSFLSYVTPVSGPSETEFSFNISWDTLTNDAFISANAGVSPLFPIFGQRGVTFIEVLDSGAVQTTTVTADGQAAHSRNTIFRSPPDAPADFQPSQYYGACLRV